MRQLSLGTVVSVTCTRELRPAVVQTLVMNADRLPTGVSPPHTAVARFLANEHRQIARSRYHRPLRGR
jgi:hypothetical protein